MSLINNNLAIVNNTIYNNQKIQIILSNKYNQKLLILYNFSYNYQKNLCLFIFDELTLSTKPSISQKLLCEIIFKFVPIKRIYLIIKLH